MVEGRKEKKIKEKGKKEENENKKGRNGELKEGMKVSKKE